MEIYDLTGEIYARISGAMMISKNYLEFLKNTNFTEYKG